MKLAAAQLYRYRLPLRQPLRLRGVTLCHREGLLLQLTSDTDAVGWGEVAPLPGFSPEPLDEADEQLRHWIAGSVGQTLSGEATHLGEVSPQWLGEGPWVASVRFGIELALWNLHAAVWGISLPQLITSAPGATVLVNGLLIGSPDAALSEARRMHEAGYQAVKLKVGRRPVDEEVRTVRSLHQELGKAVRLRLDANRAWSWDEAEAFVQGIRGCAIEYIEEPLADPDRLPELARRVGVPVALDETMLDGSIAQLAQHQYAHAIVLKPTLIGGIAHTLRLARQAERLGITPVLSASFEAGVGMRGLVALAACLHADTVPMGLGTYSWLEDDVVSPRLLMDGPSIEVEPLLQAAHTVDTSRIIELDLKTA